MADTRPKRSKTHSPRGREEVKSAALASARQLFSQYGPSNVSIRDVASHAGVNHGLIHRHFGSKEALIAAVLEGFADRFRALASQCDDPIEVGQQMLALLRQEHQLLRILAHLLLSGEDPNSFTATQGGISLLISKFADSARDPDSAMPPAAHRVLASTAMTFGWILFAPFLTAASALSGEEEQVSQSVQKLASKVLSGR